MVLLECNWTQIKLLNTYKIVQGFFENWNFASRQNFVDLNNKLGNVLLTKNSGRMAMARWFLQRKISIYPTASLEVH